MRGLTNLDKENQPTESHPHPHFSPEKHLPILIHQRQHSPHWLTNIQEHSWGFFYSVIDRDDMKEKHNAVSINWAEN